MSAQKEYEAGRTAPNTDYLEGLRGAGLDIAYILTGRVGDDSLPPTMTEIVNALQRLPAGWTEVVLHMLEQAAGESQPATLHSGATSFDLPKR